MSHQEELNSRAQMAHDLLIALAKRILAEENATEEVKNGSWPCGQSWDELSQSSRNHFKRLAREEAGVDHAAYVAPLRSGDIEVEEHD